MPATTDVHSEGPSVRATVAAAAVALAVAVPPAFATETMPEPVDLALVLVADMSTSIDDSEFRLQKSGYVDAFTDPEVVARLVGGPLGAAAVAYVEFASRGQSSTVVGWTIVRDADDAHELGRMIALAPRAFTGNTSISTGIGHATRLLADAPFEPTRRVIDVSADGRDASDGAIAKARDAALAAGITINGLAIVDDRPLGTIDGRLSYTTWEPGGPLLDYFERHVVGGPGGFVVEARHFAEFGQALTRKLVVEISSVAPRSRKAVVDVEG
jgi:hypothetical protein